MLTESALCSRLPHAGKMCLLDQVLEWQADRIVCTASSHRHADNPLRNQEGLPSVCGVEYAAQAMALHGSLSMRRDKPLDGFLASLRNLRWDVDWLHGIEDDICIHAHKLAGEPSGAMYQFRMETKTTRQSLLAGTLMVIYRDRELRI